MDISEIIKNVDNPNKIYNIYGPTYAGKSRLASHIANIINAEIINGDSTQIYKNLSVITNQPKKNSKYYLYHYIEPNQQHSVYLWTKDAIEKINNITKAKKNAIIVGGTGLYFHSLTYGLSHIPQINTEEKKKISEIIKNSKLSEYELLKKIDPDLAKRLNKNDIIRIIRGIEVMISTRKSILVWQQNTKPYFNKKKFFNIYIKPQKKILYQRINLGITKLFQKGVINEISTLKKNYDITKLPKIIGLRLFDKYLNNRIDLCELIDKVQQHTRNYAKKQFTWFNKKMEHDIIITEDIGAD